MLYSASRRFTETRVSNDRGVSVSARRDRTLTVGDLFAEPSSLFLGKLHLEILGDEG
jgi:hypothetical protein